MKATTRSACGEGRCACAERLALLEGCEQIEERSVAVNGVDVSPKEVEERANFHCTNNPHPYVRRRACNNQRTNTQEREACKSKRGLPDPNGCRDLFLTFVVRIKQREILHKQQPHDALRRAPVDDGNARESRREHERQAFKSKFAVNVQPA